MKRHSVVMDYVLAYADLLSCMNDNNNLRALFERTIPTLMEQNDRDSAMRVWDRYVRSVRAQCPSVVSEREAREF